MNKQNKNPLEAQRLHMEFDRDWLQFISEIQNKPAIDVFTNQALMLLFLMLGKNSLKCNKVMTK